MLPLLLLLPLLLQDAVDRGWLRDGPAGPVSALKLLATAAEIAPGMLQLHSRGIIHGDLSAFNVLLSSADPSAAVGRRGFVAKIGDFGECRAALRLRTRMCIVQAITSSARLAQQRIHVSRSWPLVASVGHWQREFVAEDDEDSGGCFMWYLPSHVAPAACCCLQAWRVHSQLAAKW
jgi:serine/threonine protein kinase